MAAEPDKLPEWATAQTNNDEPLSGQKATGWTPNQDGNSDWMNWWQYLVYTWILFFRTAGIHLHEEWMFATAELGAGGGAMGSHGWGYIAASADAGTIQDPTSLHYRPHARVGNNNGVGQSRIFSRWLHWAHGASKSAMEGKVSISGFGTSTNYSMEWGIECGSGTTHRIVARKKNGNANWQLYIEDAAGSGVQEVDTGIPCVAGQVYLLRLEAYTGTAKLYIDGVLRATIAGSDRYPFNEKYRIIFRSDANDAATLGYLRAEPIDAWFE